MTATSGSTERYCLMAWISRSWMLRGGTEEELLKMTTEARSILISGLSPEKCVLRGEKKSLQLTQKSVFSGKSQVLIRTRK